MVTYISTSKIFNSAKATKTRTGCWRMAVAEFCVTVFKALFFAFANKVTSFRRIAKTFRLETFTRFTRCSSAIRRGARLSFIDHCSSTSQNTVQLRSIIRCSALLRSALRSVLSDETRVNSGHSSIRTGWIRLKISKTWCCNLAARVLRCQRRRRGFDSPQHRHGIGRSVAGPWLVRPMTRVRFPSDPPLYLGVAQQ